MADWIRVDCDILNHKKVVILAKLLDENKLLTVGRVIGLWTFTQMYAWHDGDLSAWGEKEIEQAARWDGLDGEFFKAANEAGLLDNFVVHNWPQYAAKYVQKRLQRERQNGDKVATKKRQGGDIRNVTYRSVKGLKV